MTEDTTAFTSRLADLKRHGAAVLVTGEAGEDARIAASRTLFGSTDERRRRVMLCLGGDTGPDEYLPDGVSSGDADVRAIVDDATVRRPTNTLTAAGDSPLFSADETTASPITTPTPSGTEADLDDIEAALLDAIDDAVGDDALGGGELRVGVTSLLPLVARFGVEAVHDFCASVAAAVRARDGLVHFHYPLADAAARASRFADVADARVELDDEELSCRWHLVTADGELTAGPVSL